MIIFIYTFAVVFVAVVVIIGVGSLLADSGQKPVEASEGKMTAAMCTTRLLDAKEDQLEDIYEDFVIEQDLVYTYDSLNL
ncbi:MAG: hypothetical protein K5792_09565 [Butyrivibrio sp.]|nr:hypothetical protein [Butyrivibrio sp.]